MQIGELAKAASVDATTIRFYEKEGLLTAPPRTPKGYRQYGAAHRETLQFIRHCRSLDLTLPEIRCLLDYRQNPHRTCNEVNHLVASHIDQVRQRIVQLQQLELQLLKLQESCSAHRQAEQCGILQSLNSSAI
ncbi:MAG: Cd(II)/Pb(II)-responsive transcriptional regulator [Spongiibacteraceae bacterium]